MANFLTVLRMVCALLMLLCPVFSKAFYGLYLLGGFTDAIDGTVARRLGKESDFGAKLDTVADFVFVSAVIGKLLLNRTAPSWLFAWVGIIVAIKALSVVISARKYKKWVPVHSRLNQFCGFILFISLLWMKPDGAEFGNPTVLTLDCAIATLAAIHECCTLRFGNRHPDR